MTTYVFYYNIFLPLIEAKSLCTVHVQIKRLEFLFRPMCHTLCALCAPAPPWHLLACLWLPLLVSALVKTQQSSLPDHDHFLGSRLPVALWQFTVPVFSRGICPSTCHLQSLLLSETSALFTQILWIQFSRSENYECLLQPVDPHLCAVQPTELQ